MATEIGININTLKTLSKKELIKLLRTLPMNGKGIEKVREEIKIRKNQNKW